MRCSLPANVSRRDLGLLVALVLGFCAIEGFVVWLLFGIGRLIG